MTTLSRWMDDPFPHLVLENWWEPGLLYRVRDSFPPPDSTLWKRFDNGHERKLAAKADTRDRWPDPVLELLGALESPMWCDWLAEKFNIGGLGLFPDVYGGGMHMIPPAGKLDVHVDFNQHPNGLFRRLNLLIFLNDWTPGMGGELELRNEDGDTVSAIAPVFNSTAIFATSERSWHGHPNPTIEGFWRKSIAVYYYSDIPPPGYSSPHDTIFEAA